MDVAKDMDVTMLMDVAKVIDVGLGKARAGLAIKLDQSRSGR